VITDFLQKTIVLTIPTASVLDETDAAPLLYPDRQPADEGAMKVVVSDTNLPGTVRVSGVVSGTDGYEDFIFPLSGNHLKVGGTVFSAITTISVSGISSGQVGIEA
jgi:hypothetical protein